VNNSNVKKAPGDPSLCDAIGRNCLALACEYGSRECSKLMEENLTYQDLIKQDQFGA
jgi:hypothetical protein